MQSFSSATMIRNFARKLRCKGVSANITRNAVVHIRNTEEFRTEVVDSKVPVLVDFKAEWCGPCKLLTPKLLELEEKFAGRINLAIVDIDIPENDNLVAEHKINAVPTLLAYSNGKLHSRLMGLQNEEILDDLMAKLL